MICKNCSHENAPDEKVCTNCGAPLTDEEQVQDAEQAAPETAEPVFETADTAEEPAPQDAALEGTAPEDAPLVEDTAEPEETAALDTVAPTDVADTYAEAQAAGEGQKPKKRPGVIAFSGLIALVLVAVALWVVFTGVFAPKYSMPVDRSDMPISYIKDYKLYQKPVSGQTVQVSENLVMDTASGFSSFGNTVVQSADGKVVYFLENFDTETLSGTLYVSENGKAKTKIADNVLQGFVVSENGKTVVYMTNVDINTAMGQLYYYTKGIEPQLVANSTLYNTYMVSQNGSMVAFLENVDGETGEGQLYVAKTGSAPTLLDEAVIASFKVSDKGEVLYAKNYNMTTYTCDLYTVSPSKSPEFISSGVTENYVMASEFSNKTAYVTMDENQIFNFYLKSGSGEPTVIMEDLMGFFGLDVENENYLLAKMPEGSDSTSSNPDMYLKRGNGEPVLVGSGMLSPQHASASYDFKTIYYMNEYDQTTGTGTLHVRKESLFGGATDEVIAEGVSNFIATRDGKTIVYMTNMDSTTGIGTLSAYSNGQTKLLGENIFSSAFTLTQNGKAVIYLGDMDTETYIGNLYSISTTGSGTAQQIDTEVYALFYARSDKSVIYLKNYNSETDTADLYYWNGRGTPEAVDTGISMVLFE